MRNPGRAPIINRQISPGELRELNGARFPIGRIVGFAPVLKIADVMHRYFVALNVGPACPRHIGLPVTIARRLDRQPPAEHDEESERDHSYRTPTTFDKNKCDQHCREVNEG